MTAARPFTTAPSAITTHTEKDTVREIGFTPYFVGSRRHIIFLIITPRERRAKYKGRRAKAFHRVIGRNMIRELSFSQEASSSFVNILVITAGMLHYA